MPETLLPIPQAFPIHEQSISGEREMKKVVSLFAAAAVIAGPCAGVELPGIPQREKATVTAVPENTGVQIRKVTFLRSNDIPLVGNLFLPKEFDASRQYPALLCVPPAGSVKEQSAGLYAHLLARNGFVALAFDPVYAGESGGKPFLTEAPYERVEDIRYAVDYLVTLPFVAEERIGALGICAGGGYVLAAAATERRIRSIGGVSAADIGAANREGWLRNRSVAEQIAILEDVSRQRTREARGEKLMEVYMCPVPTSETAPSFREGYEYYRTPRASHPRANNRFLRRSQALKMAFSAIENASLVTQPVLLVVGENADSRWQTERFLDALPKGNKELFRVPGATHIALYDKPQFVNPAVARLTDFFRRTLPESSVGNRPENASLSSR